MSVPAQLEWLFWEADLETLELEAHADYVLGRILERGRLEDVRWAAGHYGLQRIRDFFEQRAHHEVSDKTRRLWQLLFRDDGGKWPTRPTWRRSSSAPWID